MQDLIDIGYGYDETDPFIDNSEAVSMRESVIDPLHWLSPEMLSITVRYMMSGWTSEFRLLNDQELLWSPFWPLSKYVLKFISGKCIDHIFDSISCLLCLCSTTNWFLRLWPLNWAVSTSTPARFSSGPRLNRRERTEGKTPITSRWSSAPSPPLSQQTEHMLRRKCPL